MKLYTEAKDDRKKRFGDLKKLLLKDEILYAAWNDIRQNTKAPGVDSLTVNIVEESGVADFLKTVKAELKENRYRAGKSTKLASLEVYKWLESGNSHIFKSDISKCFDSIPHKKFMVCLKKRIKDGSILSIIGSWLAAGKMECRSFLLIFATLVIGQDICNKPDQKHTNVLPSIDCLLRKICSKFADFQSEILSIDCCDFRIAKITP